MPAVQRQDKYPIGGTPATPSLRDVLKDKIAVGGAIDFPEFMATTLYHPDLGYYAQGTHQVGRNGDFFTSVSVGPLFGNLLARRFLREWHDLGNPTRWRIIECGAHDGTLAVDILRMLKSLDNDAYSALEYIIPEPLPRLRAAQEQTLREFGKSVMLVSDLVSISRNPAPGIIFGNELLDALPFHLVEWRANVWRECFVDCDDDGNFIWNVGETPHDPLLIDTLSKIGKNFPDGYRTEVRTNFGSFLEPLLGCISTGLLIWADYGFARPEYYLPERHRGTLRTFSKHHAGEDPLIEPGEMDITAHVDFTAFAETAIALGCRVEGFCNQGTWLTQTGRDWLLSLEGRPDMELLRQFQTLTHPSHLGGSFHVIELNWKKPSAPCVSPEDSHRLALCACSAPESE